MSDREEAQKHKQAGNAAYSKKQFEQAIQCYNQAIELDSASWVRASTCYIPASLPRLKESVTIADVIFVVGCLS